MKQNIRHIIQPILQSVAGGSLRAGWNSFNELIFNIKCTGQHLLNYYFNQKIYRYNKLHFGCGSDLKAEFLNIDLHQNADVFFDARNKLPFSDGSIIYIYSSHFIEHLEHSELLAHFKECYRLLDYGGILRMAVPDFVQAMKAYLNRDEQRLTVIKSKFPLDMNSVKGITEDMICYMDYLNRGIHEYGSHKIVLDFEKIRNMLISCGFGKDKIYQSQFNQTIDLQNRDYASLYIEVKK